jgi:hypothetical protein
MRTKSKKIKGGKLSVTEIDSIINDINNNYGIKKEGTDIYVNIDSDIDELKKLLSMSEEGIDEYFKNKVNDVKSILELLNVLRENVEDNETINKIKNMDISNLSSTIRAKLNTLLDGITVPVAPPMESSVPIAPPMNSSVPIAPPMNSSVPVAPPMESSVPIAPPMNSSVSPRYDILNDITKGFKLKSISKEPVKKSSISGLLGDIEKGVTLKSVPKEPVKKSSISGLLGDIEKGVTLKSVSKEPVNKKEEPVLQLSPQAQQLIARRSALGYNNDDDDDDNSWQGGSVIRFTRRIKSKSKRNSKKVKSHKRRRSLKK